MNSVSVNRRAMSIRETVANQAAPASDFGVNLINFVVFVVGLFHPYNRNQTSIAPGKPRARPELSRASSKLGTTRPL